jgi:hypothetical protein
MAAGLIERVESGVERGASALFGAAVSYAAYGLLATGGLQPQLALGAAGVGVLACLLCSHLLAIAGSRRPGFVLPDFPLGEFEFVEAPEELLLTDRLAPEELLLTERVGPDELLLGDADRIASLASPASHGPLVLDDVLAEIGPDARVVHLFDRKAMPVPGPTPGELRSRIAAHLADGAPLSAPSNTPAQSDASHALSAALAELRRSLR